MLKVEKFVATRPVANHTIKPRSDVAVILKDLF